MVYRNYIDNEDNEDIDPLGHIDGDYALLRRYLFSNPESMVLPHPSLGFGDPKQEERLSAEAQAYLPNANRRSGEVQSAVQKRSGEVLTTKAA